MSSRISKPRRRETRRPGGAPRDASPRGRRTTRRGTTPDPAFVPLDFVREQQYPATCWQPLLVRPSTAGTRVGEYSSRARRSVRRLLPGHLIPPRSRNSPCSPPSGAERPAPRLPAPLRHAIRLRRRREEPQEPAAAAAAAPPPRPYHPPPPSAPPPRRHSPALDQPPPPPSPPRPSAPHPPRPLTPPRPYSPRAREAKVVDRAPRSPPASSPAARATAGTRAPSPRRASTRLRRLRRAAEIRHDARVPVDAEPDRIIRVHVGVVAGFGKARREGSPPFPVASSSPPFPSPPLMSASTRAASKHRDASLSGGVFVDAAEIAHDLVPRHRAEPRRGRRELAERRGGAPRGRRRNL